jgi:hypothetical protein
VAENQINRSFAVGIEPCGDNGRLRGPHVVCRIVKQDAVVSLREMEKEDRQEYDQSTEEA